MLKSKAFFEALHAVAEQWARRYAYRNTKAADLRAPEVICAACLPVTPPPPHCAIPERAAGFYFGAYYTALYADPVADALRETMLCATHKELVDRAWEEAGKLITLMGGPEEQRRIDVEQRLGRANRRGPS